MASDIELSAAHKLIKCQKAELALVYSQLSDFDYTSDALDSAAEKSMEAERDLLEIMKTTRPQQTRLPGIEVPA